MSFDHSPNSWTDERLEEELMRKRADVKYLEGIKDSRDIMKSFTSGIVPKTYGQLFKEANR